MSGPGWHRSATSLATERGRTRSHGRIVAVRGEGSSHVAPHPRPDRPARVVVRPSGAAESGAAGAATAGTCIARTFAGAGTAAGRGSLRSAPRARLHQLRSLHSGGRRGRLPRIPLPGCDGSMRDRLPSARRRRRSVRIEARLPLRPGTLLLLAGRHLHLRRRTAATVRRVLRTSILRAPIREGRISGDVGRPNEPDQQKPFAVTIGTETSPREVVGATGASGHEIRHECRTTRVRTSPPNVRVK